VVQMCWSLTQGLWGTRPPSYHQRQETWPSVGASQTDRDGFMCIGEIDFHICVMETPAVQYISCEAA
jgi:hypothetical protein